MNKKKETKTVVTKKTVTHESPIQEEYTVSVEKRVSIILHAKNIHIFYLYHNHVPLDRLFILMLD